jgi:uncharacterized protein YbcI
MAGKETPRGGQALAELSNAMVALHREHFGEMAVCILTDIYTPVERTLIAAGQAPHVRRTRRLHQEALEEEYKARVEQILDRRVAAFLSVVHVDPDVGIEVFLLDGRPTPSG